jgi:alkylated DNA repair dioxygenase AlkB
MFNMNKYIKVIRKALPKEVCEGMSSYITSSEYPWEEHSFYNPETTKQDKRESGEPTISWAYTPNTDALMSVLKFELVEYMKDFGEGVWTTCTGMSNVRFNKYIEGTSMSIHCDHINLFDTPPQGIPILSILGSFTDLREYEGGDLIIEGEKLDLDKGDIVLFPSNFMYPHEITEVTKGERLSFISWAF